MDISKKVLADITAIRNPIRPVAPDHTVVIPVSVVAILLFLAVGMFGAMMQSINAGWSPQFDRTSHFEQQSGRNPYVMELSRSQKRCLQSNLGPDFERTLAVSPANVTEHWLSICR